MKPGDDLASMIVRAAEEAGVGIQDGDIIVVGQKIVSKAEGAIIELSEVEPSDFAVKLARLTRRDPRLVEVILRESRTLVRMDRRHIISETRHGFVCANAGVDASNVDGGRSVTVLPRDPDESARRIRERIREISGKEVAVIITDTHGRPLRRGSIDVAIGISGMRPFRDYRGKKDIVSAPLGPKLIAVADEVASAAELVMGQGPEGIPVAIVRGYEYEPSEESTARELVMPPEEDLFR